MKISDLLHFLTFIIIFIGLFFGLNWNFYTSFFLGILGLTVTMYVERACRGSY